MSNEKSIVPANGYAMLFLFVILFLGGIVLGFLFRNPLPFLATIIALILLPGFVLVNPNGSRVLLLFGEYIGTIKKNGLFWVNPLYKKSKISLRARNFDSERLKVNDKMGNPIIISTILVWRVSDTHKAAFDVDNYENFVRIQTDAAVRELASKYPYDNFADEGLDEDITLRSSMSEVNVALEKELDERLSIAGIEKRKRILKEIFDVNCTSDRDLLVAARENGFI